MVQKMRELRQSASIGAPSGLSSEAKTNWPTSLASKVKLSRLALAKSGSGIDAARSVAASDSPVRHGLARAVKCASLTGVPAESSINHPHSGRAGQDQSALPVPSRRPQAQTAPLRFRQSR